MSSSRPHPVERVRRLCRRGVVGVLGLSLVVDCGGGGSSQAPTVPVVSTPVLTSVTISLSAATVQVGWTDTARAAGFDQRGAPISIDTPVWTTASSAVATVDASGVVTGMVPGQTTLTASVGGKQGQAALVVVPVAVATVAVNPPAGSVSPGQTVQLGATLLDAAGDTLTDRAVTWSSTQTSVATVSPTGLVAAVTAGTAIIVASSGEQTGASVIVVTGAIAPGVVVTISQPTVGQIIGDTLPVFATARSANRISGVVASVGTRELVLKRILIGASGVIEAWIGTMQLSGTIFGTFEVVVRATDATGTLGIDSTSFVRKKLVLGGSSPVAGRKRVLPVVPARIP
jgi:hypothetical protein